MAVDVLIDGGTVITMDQHRRVLEDGAIAIDGSRIVDLFDRGEQRPDARRTIDATGGIVLPGFVDSHGHAGHGLTKGLGEGISGDAWLNLMRDIYDHASDEAFWLAESRLSALERLRFGVTTSLSMTGSAPRVDHARYAIAAASGYRDFGLRHVVAVGPAMGPWPRHYTDQATSAPTAQPLTIDRAMSVTREIISTLHGSGDGRIRAYVGPSQIVTDPNDLDLSHSVNLSLIEMVGQLNTGFHAHAYHGMVAHVASTAPELLGPHASLAHCAGITLDEVEILARTGTSASHGPLTHAYALARFPLFEAMERGVNVAISTDGTAPDRSFDLLAQARIGGQLQRVHFGDTSIIPVGRMLAMITIDAARSLGLEDEVGSLETGKRADIVIIDGTRPHLAPQILAPLRVIQHASGHDVTTVLCNGSVLLHRGEAAGIDSAAIVKSASDELRATLERGGIVNADRMHPDFWSGLRYRHDA